MLYYTSMVHNVLLTEVRLISVKEYLLFICLFVVVLVSSRESGMFLLGGKLFSPPPIFLSSLCIMERHDLEIGIKKSLGVTNSQPSEKAMALLGFPNSICKANGIVAVKHLLQRKLKEQKGSNLTHVWLRVEQIHPKRCARENAAGIRDMERGHTGSLRMDFLALKNLLEFNYFQLVWSAFVAFPDRVFPDNLALNSITQIVQPLIRH